MKKLVLALLLGGAALVLHSCCGCDTKVTTDHLVEEEKEEPILTFAVAGHTYGHPDEYTYSIYPPFLEKFRAEQEKNPVDYLFLTGDVVKFSVDSVWDVVISELDDLGIQWFIAPGNHDVGSDAQYMGGVFYNALVRRDTWFLDENFTDVKRNSFMVLNTSNPGWTVDTTAKADITDYVGQLERDSVDNIFVFTHQLWWQHNKREAFDLDSIMANSHAQLVGPSDFWQDVFPLFEEKGIETWFFAGDLGASTTLPFYYEDHHDIFHFYASGMGGGTEDNYLVVSVYENGDVQIERIDF